MANIVINGLTYNGTPAAPTNPFRPSGVDADVLKIGRSLEGKDGTANEMVRTHKLLWKITWEKTNEATRVALRAAWAAGTFSFTDEHGATYTVVCRTADTFTEAFAFTDAANANYYNITLVLRQV